MPCLTSRVSCWLWTFTDFGPTKGLSIAFRRAKPFRVRLAMCESVHTYQYVATLSHIAQTVGARCVAGDHQVDHQTDNVARSEVLSGILVERIVTQANEK
jgi:hypothetical protein